MCSYKVWIWLTAIYSIPLILVLILSDVISLVGLNAPQLLEFDLNNQSQAISAANIQNNYQNDESFHDEPRLGEAAELQRMPYEKQFKRNINENNNLIEPIPIEEPTEDRINLESGTSGLLKQNKDVLTIEPKDENNLQSDKTIDDNINDENNNEPTKPTTLKDESINEATTTFKDGVQNDDGSIDKGKNETTGNGGKDKLDDKKDDKADHDLKDKDKKDDEKIKDEKGRPLNDKTEEDKKKDSKEESLPDSKASKELNENEILKRSWNEFLLGLYSDRNSSSSKLVLNILIFIKIGFRILSLITLPLLIIGNQTSRTTYIKPFKMILMIQFLLSITITIYYAIVSTECEYYKNIGDWLPRHFSNPDKETGLNVARFYLLITFADLFPYFCIISLFLINKREKQITKKKEESQQENWDLQLRPIGLPRIKNATNSEHISPLNLHFNQNSHNNDNLPLTAGLITNEEISVNNQPFSYISNNNQSSNQVLPCYDNPSFK